LLTRSIYIVEDDDAVRTSLRSAFSVLPNTLIWGFQSGDAFLERVDDLTSGCVLLDYHMPGSNGLEVLKRAFEQGVGDKFSFIVLTGHGEVSVAVQAIKAGALEFLEKPCEFSLLMEAVEIAFAQLERNQTRSARTKAAAAKLELLSPREFDVLKSLIEGDSNKVIAKKLDISPRTVELHRAKMTDKLGARNLSDALRVAFAAGLFPTDWTKDGTSPEDGLAMVS